MSVEDGKCAIDLEVRDPTQPFDLITGWEVTNAVNEIFKQCVWGSGVGGRVGKLGKRLSFVKSAPCRYDLLFNRFALTTCAYQAKITA